MSSPFGPLQEPAPQVVTSFLEVLAPLDPETPPKRSAVRDAALRERQRLVAEAHAEGYAAGFEQGVLDGAARARQELEETVIAQITAFAQALQEAYDRIEPALIEFRDDEEERLGVLGLAVAERLVRKTLDDDRETALRIAREILADILPSREVRLRVNPFDVPLLEARKGELLAACSSLRGIEVLADPTIQGGCVLESDAGSVDARIEGVLERMMDRLIHRTGSEACVPSEPTREAA